jgi:hypothetical protein
MMDASHTDKRSPAIPSFEIDQNMLPAKAPGKMPASNWRRPLSLLILGSVFIFSRIPLLNLGFGLDADAWRIANTAFDLKHHLQYHASRFPGYPVPEFANALLINHGWLATNSLTMLLSLLSVFIYARILKILDHPNRGLLIITYAFLPVLWINSTNTMDYTWSLCFVIITWLFILKRQWMVAGLMMGLAIGSRLPVLLLLFPFSYLCYSEERNSKNTLRFLSTATITSILFYTPLLLTYGLGFIQRYPSETGLLQIGYLGIKQFGFLTLVALVVILSFSHRELRRAIADHDRHNMFVLFAILAGLISFAAMPYHIEYVIPFIPFVLQFTYRIGKRPLLMIFSILALSHGFVTTIKIQHMADGSIATSLFERGMIIRNITDRKQQLEFVRRMSGSRVDDHSTVIIGPWLPILAYQDKNVSSVRETKRMYDPNRPREGVQNFQRDISYRYLLTLDELQKLRKKNRMIYYIEGIREFTIDVYDYDLANYHATYLNL